MSANIYTIEDLLIGKAYRSASLEASYKMPKSMTLGMVEMLRHIV